MFCNCCNLSDSGNGSLAHVVRIVCFISNVCTHCHMYIVCTYLLVILLMCVGRGVGKGTEACKTIHLLKSNEK